MSSAVTIGLNLPGEECDVRYRKTFIKNVILRLDFPPESSLLSDRSPAFTDDIKAKFPVVRPQPMTQIAFMHGPQGTTFDQQVKGYQWSHLTDNEKRIAQLGTDFLTLEYKEGEYKHSDEFLEIFTFLHDSFRKRFEVKDFNRVGLRFINEITLHEGTALDWDGILHKKLVDSISAGTIANMRLARSMHQLVLVQDYMTCVLNYGIHNPDFPNPVAKRQFVLDIDASCSSVPVGELMDKVKALNNLCESIFEQNIDNGLRTIMEVIQ